MHITITNHKPTYNTYNIIIIYEHKMEIKGKILLEIFFCI